MRVLTGNQKSRNGTFLIIYLLLWLSCEVLTEGCNVSSLDCQDPSPTLNVSLDNTVLALSKYISLWQVIYLLGSSVQSK